MKPRYGDWIQTYTGKKFWPLDPRPEDFDIEDIAHALANLCRFSGHVREFYSVAQHSLFVSRECDSVDALWGLLHDAPEAYLVDLPRPVKQSLRKAGIVLFDTMEADIMGAICDRCGLPKEMPASVHHADEILLVSEARDLMSPLAEGWRHTVENGYESLSHKIKPISPLHAKLAFLDRFQELTR